MIGNIPIKVNHEPCARVAPFQRLACTEHNNLGAGGCTKGSNRQRVSGPFQADRVYVFSVFAAGEPQVVAFAVEAPWPRLKDCLTVDEQPVSDEFEAIHDFLRDNGAWTGTATELLSQLRKIAPLADLPATPKGLSQALRRIGGILVARKRDSHGERMLSLRLTSDISAKAGVAL